MNATVKGAEQRLELMARMFASGFKRMMRGILKVVITHQDRERMIRLRNEWVPVDPRVWDSNMDCTVNVGLGQFRNTLAKMLEVSGYADTNQFFKPVPFDYEPPQSEEPAKPTPEEMLLQAQMTDIQVRAQIEEQKIQLATVKQQQLDERESARIAGDLAIREFQAEEKFQNDVDLELLKASLQDGLR